MTFFEFRFLNDKIVLYKDGNTSYKFFISILYNTYIVKTYIINTFELQNLLNYYHGHHIYFMDILYTVCISSDNDKKIIVKMLEYILSEINDNNIDFINTMITTYIRPLINIGLDNLVKYDGKLTYYCDYSTDEIPQILNSTIKRL